MHRNLAAWFLASAVAVSLAACGDDNSEAPQASAASGWGPVSGWSSCSQYTTCGSCTPVQGCGWCFNETFGVCTTHPDQCANADVSEFTWTWDPTGCPGVDASVVPLDAGSPALDAGTSDAPAADAPAADSSTLDAPLGLDASGDGH